MTFNKRKPPKMTPAAMVATEMSKAATAAARSPSFDSSKFDDMIAKVNKQFGAGSIQRLTGQDTLSVEAVPTGFPSLDRSVLGVGGLPRGRVIEIYGPESVARPRWP